MQELFDLVVGTSIGAIIAAGLVIRKLSPQQLIDELVDNAATIFPAGTRSQSKMLVTNTLHKFPTGPLKELLRACLGWRYLH